MLLDARWKGERCDVNEVNARGETALTFCCRYGHTETFFEFDNYFDSYLIVIRYGHTETAVLYYTIL